MVAVLFLGLAVLLLSACSDEMEVQQSYPFKVETLPVPTSIVKGETVEIRCELKREGHFSDAPLHHPLFPAGRQGYAPHG